MRRNLGNLGLSVKLGVRYISESEIQLAPSIGGQFSIGDKSRSHSFDPGRVIDNLLMLQTAYNFAPKPAPTAASHSSPIQLGRIKMPEGGNNVEFR